MSSGTPNATTVLDGTVKPLKSHDGALLQVSRQSGLVGG